MSSSHIDFISGSIQYPRDKTDSDLNLSFAYPEINNHEETSNVLTRNKKTSRVRDDKNSLAEDGLYISDNPLTNKIIKPYLLDNVKSLDYQTAPQFRGKLVEIAIRDVRILASRENQSEIAIEIASVSVLFKRKPICKINSPFNRELHKFLIRSSACHDLSIQIHARHGESSILPLPLPQRNVKDHKMEIDFAIGKKPNAIYTGIVICTASLSTYGTCQQEESKTYLYKPSNDPNDPQNSFYQAVSRQRNPISSRKQNVKYFQLIDSALMFNGEVPPIPKLSTQECKAPDIVVTEQPAFSLLDVSLKNFFQASRPLRPSSSIRKHRTIGRTVLSVTVLRGVEVPVREESALISPFLEIEWGDIVHATSVADGPAPVWQQTMHFELPKQSGEHYVKFRLYDQHPVWGQQWLGEARIPLERHRNYQELERWVALSPLLSPILSFGYVQASPGQSHTRIYVLMKLEQLGNASSIEANALDTLLKGIQRCLTTPYKMIGVETVDDAERLVMLLPSLPMHYGPVPPRQALKVNKVDHYGRAALLATLLQGFGLQSYVLLGSSQISKWTAFVLTIEDNDVTLWNPEIADHYKLSDSRCSLMKVSRLINHSGMWENMQKSILPHNLKYNITNSKDWRPLAPVNTSSSNRSVQTLELTITVEEDAQEKEKVMQMEQSLRDKLSGWRSALGLTTIFNRHAVSVLRGFVSSIPNDTRPQLDKRNLKQLYRAYHTHGFLLNLRHTNLDDLTEQLAATKVHNITGPIEFALVCHVQRYIGKISSMWLALAILRSRD